ncbi:MAG TPA: hypothetical protein VMH20_14945 [Verrucomicrobiae bacterium]|nr:hypothetical protein [Verrucomicrobiae bacterium]
MERRKVTVASILLVFSLFPLSRTLAQRATSPGLEDRENERRSLAINMVRAINAAEAHYKKTQGTYVPWSTLVTNLDFTETGTKWAPQSIPTVSYAMYGPGPEIVPGWKLRLILSKDATSYALALEDVNDPKCSYAVFSDDRGLIRQGKSVSCTQ